MRDPDCQAHLGSLLFACPSLQLSCTPAVGAVLRLEVSLPSSSDQSWGVLLDKIDVRDRATGAVTEFPCGAWLGRSPDVSKAVRTS